MTQNDSEFGILDVVEAFTAMRHEFRLQIRESRELADAVQAATAALQTAAGRLSQQVSDLTVEMETLNEQAARHQEESADEDASDDSEIMYDDDESSQVDEIDDGDSWDADGDESEVVINGRDDDVASLPEAHDPAERIQWLIQVDLELSRSVQAVNRALEALTKADQQDPMLGFKQWLHAKHQQAGWWTRWTVGAFVRSLIVDLNSESGPEGADYSPIPIIRGVADGLQMVLDKVHRVMEAQGLTRISTLGQPFNGQHMRALGTVASTEYAPGCAAEELSPLYCLGETIIQEAIVRVAESRSSKKNGMAAT